VPIYEMEPPPEFLAHGASWRDSSPAINDVPADRPALELKRPSLSPEEVARRGYATDTAMGWLSVIFIGWSFYFSWDHLGQIFNVQTIAVLVVLAIGALF
jgi:hypothetical protein